MTGDEMREVLHGLGWKQADLCRRLDKNKNTVSKWATEGPPNWAAEYLQMAQALDQVHRRFIRPGRAAAPAEHDDSQPTRAESMATRLEGWQPPE